MFFSKFSIAILGISAVFLAACSPATDTAPASVEDSQAAPDHEHSDGAAEHSDGADADHSDGHGSHDHGAAATPSDESHGDMAASASTAAYPLKNCPITGAELGTMGDPIVEIIEGREVQFCCKACPDKFKANSALYFQKMDNEIIAMQSPDYPLDFCMVSGDELGGDHGEIIDVVVNNQLFRACCDGCVKDIKANPAKFSAILSDARAGKTIAKPEGSESKGDDHAGH
jgi:hypothetical protein